MSDDYPRYTRSKAIVTDWQAIKALSTEKDTWLCVSERDKALLSIGLVPLRWSTRYINRDNELQLPDMIDEIQGYLDMNETCCDAIANCIRDSDSVQDAIDETTNNNYYGDNNQPLESGIPALEDCGDDKVFGAVTELVRYVNRAIEDGFEQIELATNPVELMAEWFDNIPIVAIVPAMISDLFAFIQDTLGEAYLAGYTVGIEDEIRCDYFCLFKEDCTLTIQMLFEYHHSKITNTPVPSNIFELIAELNTFSLVGGLAVHVSYTIAYGFLWLGDLVGDILPFLTLPTMRSIQLPLALGANNPDPDWAILCEPCTPAQPCSDEDNRWNEGMPANGWLAYTRTAPPFTELSSSDTPVPLSASGFVHPATQPNILGVIKEFNTPTNFASVTTTCVIATGNSGGINTYVKTASNPSWVRLDAWNWGFTGAGFKTRQVAIVATDVTAIQCVVISNAVDTRTTRIQLECV